MNTNTHVGNVTLIVDSPSNNKSRLLLVRKTGKAKRHRKRKIIGKGRWVPPGGGTENDDKSQKHAAQREVLEETGIKFPLKSFVKCGLLRGYFGKSKIPLWLVHLYMVRCDNVQPHSNGEFTEISWFPVNNLPWDEMIPSDKEWIPILLSGTKLSIRIYYHDDEYEMKYIDLTAIKSFN